MRLRSTRTSPMCLSASSKRRSMVRCEGRRYYCSMATATDDGTEQVSVWLRENLGGTVARIGRRPRWRSVWFADVERDGELLELCVRGDCTDMPLIFPLDPDMRLPAVM